MNLNYKIKNENGFDINVNVIGFFKVNALEKEFIMYSIMDENPDNKLGSVLIGEVIRDEDNKSIKILDIKEEETNLVLACYNEISNQIGNNCEE